MSKINSSFFEKILNKEGKVFYILRGPNVLSLEELKDLAKDIENHIKEKQVGKDNG
jgi:hypothetical protein